MSLRKVYLVFVLFVVFVGQSDAQIVFRGGGCIGPCRDAMCCDQRITLNPSGVGFARDFNCKRFMENASAQDRAYICKQLRTQGAPCCSILPFCDNNCREVLAPNPNAKMLFDGLSAGLVKGHGPLTPAQKLAISKFLSNCEAEKLLNELSTMPCPKDWNAPPDCTMGSYLKFKLQFRDRVPGDLEAGSVSPDVHFSNPREGERDREASKKFPYTVSVTNQTDGTARELHAFPAPNDMCFSYTFFDGSSEMATTIYHELLHIWWMNKYQTDLHDSGHGTDLYQCSNYKPFFAEKLRDFYRVMDDLEMCLKTNPVP